MNIVDNILKGWNPIPHQCARCGAQLYLENRVYWKGKYFCENHWQTPRKKRKKIKCPQ